MRDRRSYGGTKGERSHPEEDAVGSGLNGMAPLKVAPLTMAEFDAPAKRSLTVHRGEMGAYLEGWWFGKMAFAHFRREQRWYRRFWRWVLRRPPVTPQDSIAALEEGWMPW